MSGLPLQGIPLSKAVEMAWISALAILIFLDAYLIGQMFLNQSRIGGDSPIMGFLALGLGLGIISQTLFFSGLFGFWHRPIFLAVLIIPLAMGWFKYRGSLIVQLRQVKADSSAISALEIFGLSLFACYVLLNFIATQGPEFFYDSLVYHLALPKLYLLNHRIIATPNMIYSGIPFGMEMYYGLSLAIADERLAKLLHFGFALATSSAMYFWCKNRIGRPAAILAVLLFYCSRMSTYENWVSQVEFAWSFYTLLATLAIIESENSPDPAIRRKFLIFGGILAGFSICTKYNAALYVIVLSLPLLFPRPHPSGNARTFTARVADSCLFLGIAFIIVSPWLLKNYFFYQNPLYPFFPKLFRTSAPSANLAGLMADAHARDLLATFSTWDGFKDIVSGIFIPTWPLNDSVGMAIMIVLPWLFTARWESAETRILKIVVIGGWFAWAATTRMPRFLLPLLPPFSILGASAIYCTALPRIARSCIVAVIYYVITLSLGGAFVLWYRQGLWQNALGISDKAAYLLHQHQSYGAPYYAGAKFINENLPQTAYVLFLGEERGYYCERPFVTASVFDVNPFDEILRNSANADQLQSALRKKGLTHLLINRATQRYSEWLSRMDSETRRKFDDFLAHKGRLIFDEKNAEPDTRAWIQVYEI